MPSRTVPFSFKAGVKRDGTDFDGQFYTESQWCRFEEDRPRSMPGYQNLTSALSGPVTALHTDARDGSTVIHNGSQTAFERVNVLPGGGVSGIVTRTPGGFTGGESYLWQIDAMYDASSTQAIIVAHAAPNMDIDSLTNAPVYYAALSATATDALVNIATATLAPTGVSGGLAVISPYLFVFGSDGYLTWSAPNSVTNFTATAGGGTIAGVRVDDSKVVRGMPLRGGGANSPAGIFWSLNSVIRGSYVGGSAIYQFDTVTDQSSVMSSAGIIEYDGVYFWAALDRFLVYNGVVRELPNALNADWFFDNLNFEQRQRVFAYKVPRRGEIWWNYPRGTATVCTHAVIYNVRANTWYDTELPGSGRTAGVFVSQYRYPFMAETTATTAAKLWQHEYGNDEIDGANTNAIPKSIKTGDLSFAANGPSPDGWVGAQNNVRLTRFEPDFVQTGDVTMTLSKRMFARDTVATATFSFATTTQKIDITGVGQARMINITFESNVAGGYFEMGQPLLTIDEGDRRPGK